MADTNNSGHRHHDALEPEVSSETSPLLPRVVDAHDVLPSHVSQTQDGKPWSIQSWPPRFLKIATGSLLTLLIFLLGAFLATCPRSRHVIPYPARQILTIICAVLIFIPPALKRSSSVSIAVQARKLLISYAGLALGLYAAIFASDDVHIEWRWDTLIWLDTLEGPQLGYMTRILLIIAGLGIHWRPGVHTKKQIFGVYVLSILGVYADVPMTLIDLAKGRPRW